MIITDFALQCLLSQHLLRYDALAVFTLLPTRPLGSIDFCFGEGTHNVQIFFKTKALLLKSDKAIQGRKKGTPLHRAFCFTSGHSPDVGQVEEAT